MILIILSLTPTDVFPKEVRLLIEDPPGFGSWTNIFLALAGVFDDYNARRLEDTGNCPSFRGIQEYISPDCITDAVKFKAADLNAGKERLPVVCGINAFNPRRLNKKWSHDAGIKFDNTGGPNAPCGTMIAGTEDNLPTDTIKGGTDAVVDLTGLFWMNNNTATEYIGEQLMTFGGSKSENLSEDEISFFTNRDQGLLKFKGIKEAVPSFKVQLNPDSDDARWSYDDRCISSDGIMRIESSSGANKFTFYFWDQPEPDSGGVIYAEINKHDWASKDIWTFEVQRDGSSAFRGIYSPKSTASTSLSYQVLKVLNAHGEPVVSGDGTDQWEKFLTFLDQWCIGSLLTWKDSCQSKRYCGLKQLNTVQNGCQTLEFDWYLKWTPSQSTASETADECCESSQCES